VAACDGRDGNPGEYRDYRFKRLATSASALANSQEQARPLSQREAGVRS